MSHLRVNGESVADRCITYLVYSDSVLGTVCTVMSGEYMCSLAKPCVSSDRYCPCSSVESLTQDVQHCSQKYPAIGFSNVCDSDCS